MSRRFLAHTALGISALVISGGLAVAEPAYGAGVRSLSVGSEGELYVIREGAYGELFPEQNLAEPGNPALALERNGAEGSSERFLVPGTETADVEDSASLLFEDESGTLFILWQTRFNVIHSRLNLIGFQDGEWSEPIEISGKPFGWKSSAQFALTRDNFRTEEDDGSLRRWSRTVIHLVWWEEGPEGEPQVQYSPVTFLDGLYTGWNPVYQLAELEPPLASGIPQSLGWSPVAEAPKIEAGRNGHSVVVGFVDASAGRLVSLEIEMVPGELSFIGDKVRAQIIEVGRDAGPDVLAKKVQQRVDELGDPLGLHPGVSEYLAAKASQEILGADPGEALANLAGKIRAQIIEVGARMTDRGFGRLATKGLSTARILELSTGEEQESESPAHMIHIARTFEDEVPATGREGVALHLSNSGHALVVSWHGDEHVYYRESLDQGWSPVRVLRLGKDLDLSQANQILEQRADERAPE